MRRLRGTFPLILGLALLVAGSAGLADLHRRADRIRDRHTVVDARVVTVTHVPRSRALFDVINVEYTYQGRTYRTELLDIGIQLTPDDGDRLSPAIDPDRPVDAALPGWVCGSRWRMWFLLAWIAGFGALTWAPAAWRDARRQRAGPGRRVDVSRLVHPAPAWAGRADDTVLTLVLAGRPDEQSREEQLAVRRVDAETYEICCVPYLQLRLALGDVVNLQPNGYVGSVVHPSQRVTLAVRGGAEVIRGLMADFPGAVLEELAGQGGCAVAAASEEQGRHIALRLEREEQAGRLVYRSVSRSNY